MTFHHLQHIYKKIWQQLHIGPAVNHNIIILFVLIGLLDKFDLFKHSEMSVLFYLEEWVLFSQLVKTLLAVITKIYIPN